MVYETHVELQQPMKKHLEGKRVIASPIIMYASTAPLHTLFVSHPQKTLTTPSSDCVNGLSKRPQSSHWSIHIHMLCGLFSKRGCKVCVLSHGSCLTETSDRLLLRILRCQPSHFTAKLGSGNRVAILAIFTPP